MKRLTTFLLSFIIFSTVISAAQKKQTVGLLIVATGKYIHYVPSLLESARTYFCRNSDVSYFIFTDSVTFKAESDTTIIYQPKLGWPYDSMHRFLMYLNNAFAFEHLDYVYALDADMLFVDTVGEEIFSDRVATQHPCYVNQRGTYETRKESKACVYPHEGTYYYAGAFNGGQTKEFLRTARNVLQQIQEDLDNGIIALWHDESHLNRYYIDNPPTLMLCPDYCYFQGWDMPFHPKLMSLAKNADAVRS